MPKKAKELSDAQIRRLAQKAGFHAVGGVAGLHLQVRPPAASWVFKKKVGDRRREFGLGGYPDITLSMARQKAREYVEMISDGRDPITERSARKSALVASQAKAVTFQTVAQKYIAKKSKEFKTVKQTQKLTGHLERYAYPFIGHMVVGDIERANILRMLQPIWETKTETAKRVRANVERILDLAGAEGLRTGDNPARWKGNLDLSLAQPEKITKVQHYAALALEDLKPFVAKLRKQEWMGAKALEFAILTAARSGEVRFATWEEINLRSRIWTVPADRMKGGRIHRVPLSPAAVALLKSLSRDHEYLFPNSRGAPLSDVAISKVPKRVGYDVTAHGFRATFRTWAQEYTGYAEEVCELALGHVNSDATRAAYARSELLDKRRVLMNEWDDFCRKGVRRRRGKVVDLQRRQR